MFSVVLLSFQSLIVFPRSFRIVPCCAFSCCFIPDVAVFDGFDLVLCFHFSFFVSGSAPKLDVKTGFTITL